MTPIRSAQLAGYALVAVVAVWAGVRMYSSHRGAPEDAGGRAVPSGRASPPSAVDALDDTPRIGAITNKIPARLPEFTLHDPAGSAVPSARFRGRSLLLNFWATWCGPCRREIPLLKTLDARWAAQGTSVVGIAVDYPDKVRDYAAQMQISYPLLVGEQDALDLASSLGIASPVFPFSVFTDRRGDVVALYVGELHEAQAQLILAAVQALDGGGSTLEQTRRKIADGLSQLTSDRAT